MTSNRIAALTAAVVLTAVTADAAERAGQTVRVQADSYQKAGAYPFNLNRGDEIFRDANLWTKEHGSVALLFDDGTDLTLGPNTEITIDDYVYSPGGGGQAAISFGKGVLRMVSGTMPKDNVRIATPVATVGIRGTTFTLAMQGTTELRGWVEQGTVTAAPIGSGQSFAFNAPAAFVCTSGGCAAVDGAGPPPGAFPADGGGAPGDVNDGGGDDGGASSGHN